MIKQFKKTLSLFFFLISAFAASNVFSSTNDIHSDYQKQLNEITTKYESQWDALTKSADKVTATISAGEQKQKLIFFSKKKPISKP